MKIIRVCIRYDTNALNKIKYYLCANSVGNWTLRISILNHSKAAKCADSNYIIFVRRKCGASRTPNFTNSIPFLGYVHQHDKILHAAEILEGTSARA